MNTSKKIIGVIGGLGPEASANLYLKMIHYCQSHYNAVFDSDYPPMIIYNSPLEGFDEYGVRDPDLVKKQLIKIAQTLENSGSECLIMACNSIHQLADEIQKAINIPLINIIEQTAFKIKALNINKVGLICSQSTYEQGLYQTTFQQHRIEIIPPTSLQQETCNQIIHKIMGGGHGIEEIIKLKHIFREQTHQGAQAIILGCTELPLAINQIHTDILLLDTLSIIIESAVDFSFGIKT